MQKATNILISLAFTIGCYALWLIIALFQSTFPLRLQSSLPSLTRLFVEHKMFLLIIPIPFLIFSMFLVLKNKTTTEINLFYLGILAVIFSLLFVLAISAVGFPWIPRIE